MNKIVLGSLFGDEGKGSMVQFLCKEELKKGIVPLVVRFSGGPQAGHRVINNGIEHVCSLVGSGVLLGCPTYLHEDVYVDPISLMYEVITLRNKGLNPIIYIHPDCRVIIPDDIMRNQSNSKTKEDGTCGCGIFECFNRYSRTWRYPSFKVAMYCPEEYLFISENKYHNNKFVEACTWVRDNCIIADFDTIAEQHGVLIFEGSQGLLLDMERGFMPHCTPSKVGLNGIPAEYIDNTEVYLVMRSYLTRHGNGYDPTGEDFIRSHYNNLEEPTNLDSGPQGIFKIGILDLDLVRTAFIRHCLDNYQKMHNVEVNIVITHMDCTPYPDTLVAFYDRQNVDYVDVEKAVKLCADTLVVKNIYLGLGPESNFVLFNR